MNFSKLMHSGVKYLRDDRYRFDVNSMLGFYNRMPDEEYIKKQFKLYTGRDLDLDNPQTFNEKLQWLKLHDRRAEYVTMVDKVKAKDYASNIIGDDHIIPTLGVWDSPDDIDFESLPDQFVLKCNHNSGSVVICKDKSGLDYRKARNILKRGMKQNFYLHGREWPYKDVQRKILAEKYMVDESGKELKDYKVFNFDGSPKVIQVDFDRFVEHKRNLYSINWEQLKGEIQYPSDSSRLIRKPEALIDMLDMAKKLSAGYPHIRTDFYVIDDKVYFGELTLYHGAGYEKFSPEELGIRMGEWIRLPGFLNGGVLLKKNNVYLLVHSSSERVDTGEVQIDGLIDYKFYCFDGKPKFLYIATANIKDGRKHDLLSFYDLEWKQTPFQRNDHSPFPCSMPRPSQFDEMISIVEKLSVGIPFVRVDLYLINSMVFFSEYTFTPGAGYGIFYPFEWERKIGSWISLPV